MTSDEDFLSLITPPEQNLGYRQGVVVTWNPVTSTNQVRVADSVLSNLPIITQSDLVDIRPGDAVAILRYNDSYAILGKIKRVNSATPWIPVPLYPQFAPLTPAGTGSYATVPVGTLVTWEGRTHITHHTEIEVDGIWGQASGSNTVTYELQLGGNTIGSWTVAGVFDVSRRGPFNVMPYRDQPFIKLEVKITASTGSGTVAIQVLGCMLR